MLRASLNARLRARLDTDERGFTLIETMIAITIIFGSLTALAFTATNGFRYVALARERQSATGLATRVMEEARALDTASLAKGMRDSDLTAPDPNIIKIGCGDPAGTYHFLSCAGDKIVHSSYATSVTPLAPYTGSVAAGGPYGYPAAYTWKVYVTNNDPANLPYAITVQVSWTAGAVAGAAKSILVQGLSFSPAGCAATTSTHPFSGPCQPYVTGSIMEAPGTVRVQGTVNGTAVDATLSLPYVQASGSAEQVGQAQGYVGQGSGSSGSIILGGASITTLADGNPSTATGTYDPPSPATPPKALTATAWSLPLASSSLTLAGASSGSMGSSISTAAANSSTAKCPSTTYVWPLSENDGAPCAWARVQQNGALSTTLNIATPVNGNAGEPTAGQGALASIGAAGTPTDAYLDRVLAGATAGRLDMKMSRTLGTTQFLAVPAGFTSALPVGWTDSASPATALASMSACTGGNYPVSVTSYTDSANASAGLNATAPTASAATGAKVNFWDGAACHVYNGGGAGSLNGSSPASVSSIPGFSMTRTHAVTTGPASGRHTWSITYKLLSSTVDTSQYARFGGVTTTRTPSSGTTITKATSVMNAPVDALLHYQILYTYDAVVTTMADLTVTINLGSLTTTSQYTAAPTGG
jgi:prepilin-type N-terminal cleavage/methylation domain-containing protein